MLPGESEGLVSAGADPGRGSGLGGVMYVRGGLVGAPEGASDVLGGGGGIAEHSKAPPSWLRFPPGFEGLGWENCVEAMLSTQSHSSGLIGGNKSSGFALSGYIKSTCDSQLEPGLLSRPGGSPPVL